MAIVRSKLDPAKPPVLTPEEIARLDAMTPEQLEENARTDTDNPPLTAAELAAVSLAREAQAARTATGLSQVAFAAAYQIPLARVRDWEQGRFRPDATARAYLKAIRHEPKVIARALKRERV